MAMMVFPQKFAAALIGCGRFSGGYTAVARGRTLFTEA
jgi:hypothetical protein